MSLSEWDIPPEVDEALKNAEEAQTSINNLQKKSDAIRNEAVDHCKILKPIVNDLTPLVSQIEELQKYRQYLSCVAHIENIRQVYMILLTFTTNTDI